MDISNIDDPEQYIIWFYKYGTGRFKFNLNLIVNDEVCSKQLFNLILKVFDRNPDYKEKFVDIHYIYEQCKAIYLLEAMPAPFIDRLKKLIMYLQYHRTDLSVY